MSKKAQFEQHSFKGAKGPLVKDEKEATGKKPEIRVVKLSTGAAPVIKGFAFQDLEVPDRTSYQQIKSKYGALAITDPERQSRAKENAKFMLNPLLKEPLGVADEERRVIEDYVQKRVASIAEEVTSKAEKVGYQAGLQKGYQEAYEQFKTEADGRLKSLVAMVTEAEAAKTSIYLANERYLMEVMYRIAKMVLLKELKTDKEYLLRLVKEILERVGVRENIRIRVSPEDAQTMEMVKVGLEKTFGHIKNLDIQASSEVKQGGCVVETEWNSIDASVEHQLEGIYNSMFGSGAEKAS